jgi:putative endonuclease
MAEWYLYLVRCRDNSLYTGISTDVHRRFSAHQAEEGAKYLKGRGPLKLVYQEKIGDKRLAHRVEHRVKRWPKSKKERLVHAGPGGLKRITQQLRAFFKRD